MESKAANGAGGFSVEGKQVPDVVLVAESKDSGGKASSSVNDDEDYRGAPVNLKAQFLDRMSRQDFRGAADVCELILQHEPESPVMLEYRRVLQQAIQLAEEDAGSEEDSKNEDKEGDDDGSKDITDSEGSSNDESSSEEEDSSADGSDNESDAETKDAKLDSDMADLDLKIGEAEEVLLEKLAELRLYRRDKDEAERRLWATPAEREREREALAEEAA
mmetsp:Transcript_38210/g.69036  ORF Transcript_38210/g.69036 Transcript_38210/m.69036 type:complete len:219 (+) Transcript_38210:13-669(+)